MPNESPLPSNFTVYTIKRAQAIAPPPTPPGDAVRVESDQYGNVIFRKEAVKPDKIESGLNNCFALARKVIERAGQVSANYRVDSITLKLELDAEVGLMFVGDASLQAGIEIEIKRIEPKPADGSQ
ncbi:MAG TPA: hypothetical protein VN633_18620 [Bryobacteraceae bacterium]|nr:hypothetical protein [Bryobacteraceae bacterium]